MIFPLLAANADANQFAADAALDLCTPNLVTLAIFSSANRGGGATRNDNVLSKFSFLVAYINVGLHF
jgi:hypothetical protein